MYEFELPIGRGINNVIIIFLWGIYIFLFYNHLPVNPIIIPGSPTFMSHSWSTTCTMSQCHLQYSALGQTIGLLVWYITLDTCD